MALALDTPRPFCEGDFGDHRVLNAVKIYEGAVVSITAAGYAKGYAGTDTIFAGIAVKQADNSSGAAGAITVKCRRGIFFAEVTLASAAQTDVGTTIYASDDGTFTLTSTSNLAVGVISRLAGTNLVEVKFATAV